MSRSASEPLRQLLEEEREELQRVRRASHETRIRHQRAVALLAVAAAEQPDRLYPPFCLFWITWQDITVAIWSSGVGNEALGSYTPRVEGPGSIWLNPCNVSSSGER